MTDVDWTLLAGYAAGDCTDGERAIVERRLLESPEHQEMLALIRSVAAEARWTAPIEARKAHLARVHARIAAATQPQRRRVAWPVMAKMAAAVLLILGGSLAGSWFLGRSRPPAASTNASVHTITTGRGERMSLRLADGTRVLLAPASTLRFSAAYGAPDRSVQLQGEAAFTVTHDARRPFAVRTADLLATDLGTEFIVRRYAEDKHTAVAVREGVVEIVATSGDAGSHAARVEAGRQGYISTSGRPVVEPADTAAAFAWTEGRLVFHRTPLALVVRQIELWHDVKLRLASPELGQRGVTSAFRTGELVSEMVNVIATALNLEVVYTEPRTYTLRAR